MTNVILMRHGETAYDPWTFVGVTDYPLSKQGERHAEQVAEQMATEKIDVIYCSNLKRSKMTAEIIGKYIGLKPVVSDKIHEVNFGIFENMHYQTVVAKFPKEFEARKKDVWNYKVPKGESYKEASERALKFIRNAVKKNLGKTILFVIHASLMKAILHSYAGKDWKFIENIKYHNLCRIYLKNEGLKATIVKVVGDD